MANGRVDLRIVGGGELKRLGRDLQRAGAVSLKRELIAGLQRATKGAKAAVVKSALDNLPKSGGLNVWVAELGVVTDVKTSGRHIGVRITGTKNKSATTRHRRAMSARNRGISTRKLPKGILFGRGLADLNRMDRGRIKHPTYGHRPWQLQDIKPGFFTNPLKGPIAFQAQQECIAAIAAIEREISSKSA